MPGGIEPPRLEVRNRRKKTHVKIRKKLYMRHQEKVFFDDTIATYHFMSTNNWYLMMETIYVFNMYIFRHITIFKEYYDNINLLYEEENN